MKKLGSDRYVLSRCDHIFTPKPSILGCPGLHFASILAPGGTFLRPGVGLWTPLATFWEFDRKWSQFQAKVQSHFGSILAPKSIKLQTSVSKCVSRPQSEKSASSDLLRSGPMWIPYSKYHCFGKVQRPQF